MFQPTISRRAFRDQYEQFMADWGCETSTEFYRLTDPEIRTHVQEGGSGDPLVFIHGGTSLAADWAPLLATLQSEFSVYAPDYPGRGLTEYHNYRNCDFRSFAVEFVDALLDALELDTATLVGNSMGGYFGIAYALAEPDRVDKLVLVGAPAGIDTWVPPVKRLMAIPGLNRLLVETVFRPSLDQIRDDYGNGIVVNVAALDVEYFQFKYQSRLLPGVQKSWYTALEQLISIKGFRRQYYLREELDGLDTETLFIWGDSDGFAPPASGERACETMPNAQITVVNDAGHFPWFDDLEGVAKPLSEFVRV